MFKKKPGRSRDAEILESLEREPLDVGADCRIEDFEQLEMIGSGTFGHVRLCKHKATGRHFAIKVQKKNDVIRLKQVEHVLSEKKILGAMNHPFIVRMPAAFQDSKNLYMVLELVIGGEIFSHLRRAGRFSNETSRIYAAQIVLAICHLHEHNVVYRDLKPENLLLDEKGFLKITDFGALVLSRPSPGARLRPAALSCKRRSAVPQNHSRCDADCMRTQDSPRRLASGRGRSAERRSTWRLRSSRAKDTARQWTGGR